jgi:hypothetical protein
MSCWTVRSAAAAIAVGSVLSVTSCAPVVPVLQVASITDTNGVLYANITIQKATPGYKYVLDCLFTEYMYFTPNADYENVYSGAVSKPFLVKGSTYNGRVYLGQNTPVRSDPRADCIVYDTKYKNPDTNWSQRKITFAKPVVAQS